MPEVSVIIPTYNSSSYLVEAVESVLAQTYKDFERYHGKVRYLRQKNAGVARARNHGIAESAGNYIAFLDADDTWFPAKLSKQMNALRETPGSLVCYSAFVAVTSDLKPIGVRHSTRRGRALNDLLLHGNVVGSICTVVSASSLMRRSGGFDPELSQCADWDMWVRLAAHTEFIYLDEPLVTYRQHESNMSRNAPLLEKDSVRVLEKGFSMEGVPQELLAKRRVASARNNMVLAGTYFQAGLYKDFARCALRAVMMDARQVKYLFAFPLRVVTRAMTKEQAVS